MRFRVILTLCAISPVLVAAHPVRLQPAGPWNVNYADNSCRLLRDFGHDGTLTKFGLESTAPDQMDMLVVGKPLSGSADSIPAQFLPIGTEKFHGMRVEAANSGYPAAIWSHVPILPEATRAEIERERAHAGRHPGVRPEPTPVSVQASRRAQRQQFADQIRELEIETSHQHPVILEMDTFGKALAAFDKCSRDSLKDWGVDPTVEEKIVRPPWPVNEGRWLGPGDYPASMLKEGKESQVMLRLLVDASGRVTKCTSVTHFQDQEFNRISCDKVSRTAQFEPAEFADGTKVPSYYTFRVIFRIAH